MVSPLLSTWKQRINRTGADQYLFRTWHLGSPFGVAYKQHATVRCVFHSIRKLCDILLFQFEMKKKILYNIDLQLNFHPASI